VLGFAALGLLPVACGLAGETPRDETTAQPVKPATVRSALTGADTCAEAPLAAHSLDEPVVITDTTVGETDDIDLPDATTDPTCTAAPPCIGAGATAGARGIVWPGCGTGPDKAYRFQVDAACELTVTMVPDVADLGLYLFSTACASDLAACACVSDNAFAGMQEAISSIQAEPGVNYYLLVDGYQNPPPATDPPSSGSYTLTISRTSGTCNLVANCGNDSVESGEACDDGNTESCDGCSADCTIEETGCGDGLQCGDEECDDGNDENGDGCSATCTEEADAPADSGTEVADADVPAEGGAAGAGNGGENNGGDGNANGGNSDTDAAVGGAEGAIPGNTGKGQVKGGGGMAPTEDPPTTAAQPNDDGGGCAATRGKPQASLAWLALLGVFALRSRRRR
jgi:MYXO-CTERM domain-containing protein